MAELADALDLGSSGNPRAGSSPVTRTKWSVHNGFELWTLVFYINCFLSYMYRAGLIPLFCFMQFGCIFDRNTH